jgi:hypothetical protein
MGRCPAMESAAMRFELVKTNRWIGDVVEGLGEEMFEVDGKRQMGR